MASTNTPSPASKGLLRMPPSTVDEYLEREGLSEWPVIDYSLPGVDLSSERDLLGTKDDILQALRDHAPAALNILDDLDAKIDQLQQRLDVYASQIVTEGKPSSRMQPGVFHAPAGGLHYELEPSVIAGPLVYKPVMERAAQSDAVKAHKKQRKDKATELRAIILGSKARSVEMMSYPGFKNADLTGLPHGLEAPQILDRVTRAQDFNPGFSKFWKKLFQSEASVAVMLDTFWWLFLDKFEPQREEEQRKIFNRIADSFVALFTSVNPVIKDKFFGVYADCLAQAIFAAYWEAFVDSHKQFSDGFKQDIISLCSEWIAGVKAQPEAFWHWNVKKLQPKSMTKAKEEDKGIVVLMTKEGKINPNADFSISVDPPKCTLSPQLLEIHDDPSNFLSRSLRQPPGEREAGRSKTLSKSLPESLRESHQVGPGPDFERVRFNITGRSPLVAHYLHMKGLASNEHVGRNVRRTEVSKLQSPAPTYKDIIRDSKKFTKELHEEYHKISEILAKEMAAIEKQKAQQTREIEDLKTQILQQKTDLKIMSEKILDYREREGRRPRKLKSREVDYHGENDSSGSTTTSSDDNSSGDPHHQVPGEAY